MKITFAGNQGVTKTVSSLCNILVFYCKATGRPITYFEKYMESNVTRLDFQGVTL
jgi:hypothetical protein